MIAPHDRARYAVHDSTGDIYAVHGFIEKSESYNLMAVVSRQNNLRRAMYPQAPVYFYQPPVLVPANNLTYLPNLNDVHLYLDNR